MDNFELLFNHIGHTIIGIEKVAARNIKEALKELFEASDDGFLLFCPTSSGIAEESHWWQYVGDGCSTVAHFAVAERLSDKCECLVASEIFL